MPEFLDPYRGLRKAEGIRNDPSAMERAAQFFSKLTKPEEVDIPGLGPEPISAIGGPQRALMALAAGALRKVAARPDRLPVSEMETVLNNLRSSGTRIRDYPVGHMITPEGKGLDPLTARGIANHWEVAVDAGYLPADQLKNLSHSPESVVNGLLKKGWIRDKGDGAWSAWDMDEKSVENIQSVMMNYANQPDKYLYLDFVGPGNSFSFRVKDFIDSGFSLKKTLSKLRPEKYETTPPMDFGSPEIR